jgi:hypothetical protein
MKTRTPSVELTGSITLLLFWALASQVIAAPVRFDIFPEGQRAFPVSLIFEGEVLQPPKAIERAPSGKADHSSPETVLAAMLKAVFDEDTNAYNSLYVTTEQTSSLAKGSKGHSMKVAAAAKLAFGEFTILVCEIQSPKGGALFPMVFRKAGEKFFLTDALSNTNTAYELFRGAFLFGEKPVLVAKPPVTSKRFEETVFAPGKLRTPPPITVQFEGQVFHTPLRFTNAVTREKQSLASPEAALAAVYSATKATDVDWYMSLVAPDERESASDFGVPLRKMLQDRLPQLASKLALQPPPDLIKVVRYGDYAILLLRAADAATPAPDWLVLKKVGADWLLSDKLRNGDAVLGYFLGKTEMFGYGYQKVLPTL